MNLHAKLLERETAGKPVTVGVIGAGKFGTMYLSQARLTAGTHVVAVADLDIARARSQLQTAGWPAELYAATSLDDAHKRRATFITADAEAMIADPRIEVIVEATGVPGAGIHHALAAIKNGKHIVMVNVEADAVAGPLLARKAKAAGVVYSLAWGDQPALICEQVDWARAAGFKVISAGKGTRYEPHYHKSNPDNVWDILDKYLNISDRASINPKMFNSFVDGTKSGIEMTAVCNAPVCCRRATAYAFRRRHASNWPISASLNRTAALWKRKASPKSLRRSTATAATYRIISRLAPMSCSKATQNTHGAVSRNTRCCQTRAANTPRCTGRSI